MRRARARDGRSLDDPKLPKYSIAIASDLSGVPQQQLRRMEEGGLVSPERSKGNMRRYSDDDVRQIAEVVELAESGMNPAGIRAVLASRDAANAAREELEALRRENAALREELKRLRQPMTTHEPDTSATSKGHARTKL